MKTITYTTFHSIAKEANKRGVSLYETNTSYSFRIFEGKNCTELHIYQKN
jgi:hypothetical protein